MTFQVAQPCKYEFAYTTIHLKFFTNFTLEAFSEIGKGQQLAYSSGNLPSYSRGRSKRMGSSTSQVAPVCLLYVCYIKCKYSYRSKWFRNKPTKCICFDYFTWHIDISSCSTTWY